MKCPHKMTENVYSLHWKDDTSKNKYNTIHVDMLNYTYKKAEKEKKPSAFMSKMKKVSSIFWYLVVVASLLVKW